ncbi:MAG: hypothetical protein E7117_09320 [Bacteroidales bacterium]|nr:hypothetical protein [Bacteroidales bacterium]
MIRKIILVLSLITAMTGCAKYDLDEVLLQRSDISMTWKSEVQISYSPLTCQISHSEHRNEYRVHDDKIGNWFVVKCSEKPSYVGQKLSADVSWTTDSNIKHGTNLEFSVEKMDNTGLVWMWNKSSKIGLVIKNL